MSIFNLFGAFGEEFEPCPLVLTLECAFEDVKIKDRTFQLRVSQAEMTYTGQPIPNTNEFVSMKLFALSNGELCQHHCQLTLSRDADFRKDAL